MIEWLEETSRFNSAKELAAALINLMEAKNGVKVVTLAEDAYLPKLVSESTLLRTRPDLDHKAVRPEYNI